MNDLQIEYFLTVAENLSFTKTAETRYVTQSAISRQIAGMEEELGVTLFDRSRKQIRLTDAGRLFFDFYKNYRIQFQDTLREAKLLNQRKNGQVKVGYIEYWNLSSDLLQALRIFSENYPNVKLVMECMRERELTSALKNEQLDLVLTISDTMQRTPDIKVETLVHISRILLISRNHPLAQKTNLSIRDLQNTTFFSFGHQTDAIRELVEQIYGFVPEMQSVNNMESAIACVRNGMGVAAANAWTAIMDREEFLELPFPVDHEIVLAIKKNTRNKEAVILANELSLIFHRREEKDQG